MSVEARVIEVLRDGNTRGHGDYEFLSIPSPGDRVVVVAPMGDLDIMKVLYVEHSPLKVPHNANISLRDKATIMIYVEFAERFTG